MPVRDGCLHKPHHTRLVRHTTLTPHYGDFFSDYSTPSRVQKMRTLVNVPGKRYMSELTTSITLPFKPAYPFQKLGATIFAVYSSFLISIFTTQMNDTHLLHVWHLQYANSDLWQLQHCEHSEIIQK